MLQGKVDQIMMNASIGIRQIEPAHINGAMFLKCASWRAAAMHPGTPGMKAFWTVLSMYLLATMKDSQRCLRMEEDTFSMHDVKAMGLKCPGTAGFSLAAALGMSRITPSFHACGTTPVSQHELNKSRRAGNNKGHCFSTL